jgi:hypothetical protein
VSNSDRTASRGALALVPPMDEEQRPTIWFCGHCGAQPAAAGPPASDARVCGDCGLGLLLETAADAAPAPGGAFLVLDRSLSVCAVSRGAEELLATSETDAVDHHVSELLVPAYSEAGRGMSLAAAVSAATLGADEVCNVFVRPANLFGVRLRARIVHCGPPQAALLAFELPGP